MVETAFTEGEKIIMMENILSFMRAAAPWISMGLLIAFLCVRPAIRKGKAEDDYAEEGMCVGMCLTLTRRLFLVYSSPLHRISFAPGRAGG